MRLGWNRDEDGVITVFAYASDGRGAPIADFWVQPLIDNLGMSRPAAMEWQQQFAELLVNAHNRHFAKAPTADCGESDEANARLITSAPQMLEFATHLQWEVINGAIEQWKNGASDFAALGIIAQGVLILDEARRAAIAAATGEEK